MNILGNWTKAQINEAKEQIVDHYRATNKPLPIKVYEFISMENYEDLDALKDAAVAMEDEIGYMDKIVSDICFTINTKYQTYYNLDEDNWEKIN